MRISLNPVAILLIVLVGVMPLTFAGVWVLHKRVERIRIANVERALIAGGYQRPIMVRPAGGGHCLRAQAGFFWSAAGHGGMACAGPGDKVELNAQRGARSS